MKLTGPFVWGPLSEMSTVIRSPSRMIFIPIRIGPLPCPSEST